MKVYECPSGQTSRQDLKVIVCEDAFFFSLPDPVVCFKEAIYAQKQASYLLKLPVIQTKTLYLVIVDN